MDADSSYGGSDTAQDCNSANNSSLDMYSAPAQENEVTITTNSSTTVTSPTSSHDDSNNVTFYHKNEVVLPINYDETDFQKNAAKEPHYMSTANLNIENNENCSNLEAVSNTFKSTNQLNVADDTPKSRKKSFCNGNGVDNPAFQQDEPPTSNGQVNSTFGQSRPCSNGELNSTLGSGKSEPLTEAVNLELINLKPNSGGKDVAGQYENISNGLTTIPIKKEADVEIGNPYDEYFVPVNEHRKYMR